MAWFRNHYHCPRCGHAWTDEWSATADDDCSHCGARHISPLASDDLTDVIVNVDDETFVLKRSSTTAEQGPDYIEIGRFSSRLAAERASGRGAIEVDVPRRQGLREAKPRHADALDAAILRLRDARDQAIAADCPALVRKIRSALKSADGARRHMAHRLAEEES